MRLQPQKEGWRQASPVTVCHLCVHIMCIIYKVFTFMSQVIRTTTLQADYWVV